MPILAFTIALFLGVSSPQYQEFRKHSNGNAAYSITFVDPCETGHEIPDMRLLQQNLSCSNRSRLIINRQVLSVVNKSDCKQLAQAAQDDVSLRGLNSYPQPER